MSGLDGICGDITVRDCRLSSRSSAIRIGYGANPVRGVSVSNIEILESNRGICICARQADVEDIEIESCKISTRLFHGNWWGRGEPLHISAVRFSEGGELFSARNIRVRDVAARGENAITLFAEEAGAIEGVRLERVGHLLSKSELFGEWGGNLDLRPCADIALSISEGGTAPLWAVGVQDIQTADCEWEIAPGTGEVFSAGPHIC